MCVTYFRLRYIFSILFIIFDIFLAGVSHFFHIIKKCTEPESNPRCEKYKHKKSYRAGIEPRSITTRHIHSQLVTSTHNSSHPLTTVTRCHAPVTTITSPPASSQPLSQPTLRDAAAATNQQTVPGTSALRPGTTHLKCNESPARTASLGPR